MTETGREEFLGLVLDAWDLNEIVAEAEGDSGGLFKLPHINNDFLKILADRVDNAVFVVLFSVGDPAVFNRLTENRFIGENYLAYIRVGDEYIGIIYKAGLEFSNFRILLDNYNGRDPGEKIVTVELQGVLVVLVKIYGRKINKKYMLKLMKIVFTMHGTDKPAFRFVACYHCR